MAQIAITLPEETLEIIERELENTGETQSESLTRLIDTFAKQQKEAEMVAQYKRGYELYPETEEEVGLSMALARNAFSDEYWDDDYRKMQKSG